VDAACAAWGRRMTSGAEAGLAAMRRGAGLREHQSRAFLRVVGKDARDFLQRMTSQDLGAIPRGGFARTLVLTPEGRMLGAPWVWALEDHLLLDLDVETAPRVRERLERYVLTDDVGFEDATTQHARVLLIGPEAPNVLTAEGFGVPDAGTFRSVELGGTRVHVARAGAGEPPVYRLLMQRPHGGGAPAFPGREDPDVRTVGAAAWNAFRVLTRRPAWGHELTAEILPLEARVEDEAISFDKGCYPGQEPVVMAKHRGHPPTLLVRLKADGAAAGAGLLQDGRPVGRLTTVTSLTQPDEPNALGFVRHGLVADAPTLEVEGGGRAQVLEGEDA